MSAKKEGAGVAFLLAMVLIVPIGLYRGWVVHLLWRWFVVPLGVVEIGVTHAWGLGLLVGLLTQQRDSERSETPVEGIVKTTFESLFLTTAALLIGWVLA